MVLSVSIGYFKPQLRLDKSVFLEWIRDYKHESAISKMSQCNLCNNLKKKSGDDVRLALDFVPSELCKSAETQCPACNVILAGIQHSEDGWTLAEDVTRIYVFGLANKEDSLSLELYFKDDRPKVILEVYSRERNVLSSECFHISRFFWAIDTSTIFRRED